MFKLHGRRALVTGGSSGIGSAIARLFSEAGAKVAICHLNDEANAASLQNELGSLGKDLYAKSCDVSCADAVTNFFGELRRDFGIVDILVNCAGVGGDLEFSDMDLSVWDRMISINLRSVFLVSKQVFPSMVEQKYGRIINISSQLAYKGAPGLVHYCAAKAGVVGFTRALAYEGAPHNVLVNAIAPGPVSTPLLAGLSEEWQAMKKAQLPLGRFGRVEEIAPTALLLASEDGGSFYCGQTLSPNGGDVML